MANFIFKVIHNSSGDTKIFDNTAATVEYCQAQLHEKFTIDINGGAAYRDDMRVVGQRLVRNLSNVTIDFSYQ